MKIPGWIALIIVPVIIVGASLPAIRESNDPVALGFIAVGTSLVVALVAWGILSLLDQFKR